MKSLLLFAVAVSLEAQTKWLRVESPNFELYIDGDRRRATSILEHFEKVRAFFRKTIAASDPLLKPKVVVFSNEKAFRAFGRRKSTAAFYHHLPHRDLIVIGPSTRIEALRTITHEYVHLLVAQSGMHIQLWLNEGLAELYSTLEPVGGKIRVGIPIPSHNFLARSKWLDMKEVLNATRYADEEHIGAFYAESWALCHMLVLEDDLRVKFPRFLEAIQKGMPSEQAVRKVYGMTAEQLGQHVQGYLRSATVNNIQFNFGFASIEEKLVVQPAEPFDSEVMLADLYFSAHDWPTALEHAGRAAAIAPNRPEPHEIVALVKLVNNDSPDPRKAFELGSRNAGFLSSFADKALLARALEIDPENFDALYLLALQQMNERDYAAAWKTARGIKRLAYSDTPRYVPLFVRAAWSAGAKEEAARMAEEWSAWAVNEKDKAEARKLLVFVSRGTPFESAPAEASTVTGLLNEIECDGGKIALHVLSEKGMTRIEVDGKNAIQIEGDQPNIGCGVVRRPRKVRVGVSAVGLARKLEYLN